MFRVRSNGHGLRSQWLLRAKFASRQVPESAAPTTRQLAAAGVVVAATCFGAGFAVGRDDSSLRARHVPEPRSCCDAGPEVAKAAAERQALVSALVDRLGAASVVTEANAASPFTSGARIGGDGDTIAVACPNTLQEAVDTLQLCVDAGVAVVPQGANTGLTGGSVPRKARPSVVLNMRKLKTVTPIAGGKRVVCLAGAGILDATATAEAKGREGHSSLGSTFLNPSVAGGVSFGSGGTQIRKGPAYTERSLYCVVGKDGKVRVVNTLGLTVGCPSPSSPPAAAAAGKEEGGGRNSSFFSSSSSSSSYSHDGLFAVLESGEGLVEAAEEKQHHGKGGSSSFAVDDNDTAAASTASSSASSSSDAASKPAFAKGYAKHVCAVEGKEGEECARFNADTSGPPPNRCEGKVLVLATVHETFPKPTRTRTLWISCGDVAGAAAVRKACLACPRDLPASCEYMDGTCCETVDKAGRGLVLLIRCLGMSPMGAVWALRQRVDSLPLPYAKGLLDRLTWLVNPLLPPILTPQVQALMRKRRHNVLVEACDYDEGESEDEDGATGETRTVVGTGAVGAESDRLLARIQQATKSFDVEVAVLQEEEEGGKENSSSSSSSSSSGAGGGGNVRVVVEAGAAMRAKLFRFACAPAFSTRAWGEGMQGLSLDYALPKSFDGISFDGEVGGEVGANKSGKAAMTMVDVLPEGVAPFARCVYGHFGCNVVHEDILFAPGVDVHECKRRIKAAVEAQGGKLPAEHGHGTEYEAPQETQDRWRALDPSNALNPGVGGAQVGPNYTGHGGLSH